MTSAGGISPGSAAFEPADPPIASGPADTAVRSDAAAWSAAPATPGGVVPPATLVVGGLGLAIPGLLMTWWGLAAAAAPSPVEEASVSPRGWIALGVVAVCSGFTMVLVGLHRSLSRRDALVALLTERLLNGGAEADTAVAGVTAVVGGTAHARGTLASEASGPAHEASGPAHDPSPPAPPSSDSQDEQTARWRG